jgi:uncharacterized FlgJ-related protein
MYFKFNKEKLAFEKVNLPYKLILIIGLFLGLSVILGFKSIKNEQITVEQKLIVLREYNEFSEAKLIDKIKSLNFRYPHIILAQAKLESGHFTSNMFLKNNNIFGMKEANSRAHLARGTRNNHALYDSWQDSVVDYALYYSTYLYDIRTEGEYFEYLRQNYAEDQKYVQRLKELIEDNKLKQVFE